MVQTLRTHFSGNGWFVQRALPSRLLCSRSFILSATEPEDGEEDQSEKRKANSEADSFSKALGCVRKMERMTNQVSNSRTLRFADF